MNRRVFLTLLVVPLSAALAGPSAWAAEPSHELAPVKKLPEGLSKQVAAKLNPQGYRLSGPKGPLADIWLAKQVAAKPGFQATFSINYPFLEGELIGALRVPEKTTFKDFRGQELKAGVYTLRYGLQPQDGNHIGTSETRDFLLAVPAKTDTDPKPIASGQQLAQKSAKSVSTTHPAIFSLLEVEKAPKKTTLEHDGDHDYWILHTTVTGQAGKKKVTVPVRLIVVGVAEI